MTDVVVRDCKVIRDAHTNQSKGYAFVCFVRQEVITFPSDVQILYNCTYCFLNALFFCVVSIG